MVFLQRRRPRSGAVGRRENRWTRLAAPWVRTKAPFISCYRSTAGLPRLFAGALGSRTLTLAEREEISRGIASGLSIRAIARSLQSAASTVSREVARHGGRPKKKYRASKADHQAWKLALRPRPCLLALHRELRTIVARKLILNLVTGADFWLAEATVSLVRRMHGGCVPRNHLP